MLVGSIDKIRRQIGWSPAIPLRESLRDLWKEKLERMRSELNTFWGEVAAYNKEHPIPDHQATRVTFYFGQVVTTPVDADAPASNATEHDTGDKEKT